MRCRKVVTARRDASEDSKRERGQRSLPTGGVGDLPLDDATHEFCGAAKNSKRVRRDLFPVSEERASARGGEAIDNAERFLHPRRIGTNRP